MGHAYWYDIRYGMGVAVCEGYRLYDGDKVYYIDGSVHSVDAKKGTSVISSFISYSSKLPAFYALDYSDDKNESYYNSNPKIKVIEVDASENEMKVEVYGGNDKIPEVVTIASNEMRCTCYEKKRSYYYRECNCRHIYAVSKYFEDLMYKANHAYLLRTDPDIKKSLFLDFVLKKDLKNLSELDSSSKNKIEKAKDIVSKAWEPDSEEYFKLFLDVLMVMEDGFYRADFLYSYLELIFALLEDQRSRNYLEKSRYLDDKSSGYYSRQTKSNRVFFRKVLKAYDKALKEMEKGNYRDEDSSYDEKNTIMKMRKDWNGLLDSYISSSFEITKLDYPYLNEMKNSLVLDEKGEEKWKMLLLAIDSSSSITYGEKTREFFYLLSLLSENNKVDLFSRLEEIRIDVDILKTLSVEDQKMLISSTDPTIESLAYIMNEVLKDEEDSRKGDYLLSILSVVEDKHDSSLSEAFLKHADTLSDGRLLFYYLDQHLSYPSNYSYNKEIWEIEKEIKKYFATDFTISEGVHFPVTNYLVYSPYDRERPIIDVKEEGGVTALAHCDKRVRETLDTERIKEIVLENRKDEYEEKKREVEEKISTRLFSKNNKAFASDFSVLTKALGGEEKIILSQSAKATIEYYFYFSEDSPSVSFKVGNVKMYQVKDAYDFVSAFKNRTTVEYGRDLTLTHEEENLNPQDAFVMRLLMASRLSVGRKGDSKNKRYVTLSPSLFSSILDGLKGRKVFFNENDTMVTLSKEYYRARVDEKYNLKTTLGDNQTILALGNKGYVFTKEENGPSHIDYLSNSADEVKILSFFSTHGYVSIKPIIHDFKRDIYSRYSSFIDIDPSLKTSFKLSEISISAYFDYSNRAISVETKIEKNGKELSLSSLERHDREKYDNYQSYLDFLGFDERGKMEEEGKVLSFFRMDFSRLRSLCTVYLSESLSKKEMVSLSRQVFRITYNSGIMDIFLEKSDFSEKELEEILNGLREKKKYIILKGDRIVDLESREAKDFQETVSDFGIDEKNLYKKKQISLSTAIKAFAHERNCHVDKYLRNMIEDLRNFKNSDIPLPRLNAKLREYQREGYNWLSILSSYNLGGVLADDMGLGKTIQMIALMKSDKTKKPSLVVCPKSLVFNWKNEIMRFDGETECVEVYGSEAARTKIIQSIDYGRKTVYVTSYESFRIDSKKYNGKFLYVVLDEAQNIKNVYAQRTKSVKTIDCFHRFALTGTPIENSVVDLWSIFDFIMPGYLEDLSIFKGADHESIRRKVAPFILRRTKEDVLSDLPAKYERIISAEMGDEQRKIYEAVKNEASDALDRGDKAFDILPYLTRLRQICIDPGMYLSSYKGTGAKMEMLSTLIPSYIESGHRILVFSQFVKALESLRALLDSKSIPTYILTGDTPAKERISLTNNFNENQGVDVFLISLKAGGTGLNLTGADTVIHLDPWWNVAAEDQADDRTHRIGQKRNVEVIKLIASASIEERVVELQEMKKDIIDKVISNDDRSVANATLEDIAFILK